jgi:hypothetical protein
VVASKCWVVADPSLLRQIVNAGQAHARLPSAEEQETLDLLWQLELNYLATLASATVRNHAATIGDTRIQGASGQRRAAPRHSPPPEPAPRPKLSRAKHG